jgi:hypothetical protein
MKERYAKGQLAKDVKKMLSLISENYRHYGEVERFVATLDEPPRALAYHAQRSAGTLHLVMLPLGCEDKAFKRTPCICWRRVGDEYIRIKHLPGACPGGSKI